jgi:PAS domain S-box-containing protein
MDTDATHGPGPAEAAAPGMLAAFLARSSDAVLVTDHHGRIALINPPTERLLGYELGGLAGQPVQRLFPSGLPSPALERSDGGPERRWREAEMTVRALHRDGSEIALHASVTYPDDARQYASVVFLRPTGGPAPAPARPRRR